MNLNLNVLNPKQLERQLKAIETRYTELQGELRELDRMKKACLILMGNPVEFDDEEPQAAPAPAAPKPKKAPSKKAKAEETESTDELPSRIGELLKVSEEGLSADDIYDELKAEGSKSSVGQVYATLEAHPELFTEGDEGNWKLGKAESAPAS